MHCVNFLTSNSIIPLLNYHPNTNGLVERQNSTVASSLRTYCSGAQEKWTEVLPGVLMGHRKSPSSHSTEYSPYYLLFGEEMRMPFDVSLEPKDNLNRDAKDHISELIDQLKVTNEIVIKTTFNGISNKIKNDMIFG